MSTTTETDALLAHMRHVKRNPEHKQELQQYLEKCVARLQSALDNLKKALKELKS